MTAASISSASFELRDAGGNLVAAAITYSATTRVATLNPTPTLTANAVYTVNIKGGASGSRVLDLAGNPLAATRTFTSPRVRESFDHVRPDVRTVDRQRHSARCRAARAPIVFGEVPMAAHIKGNDMTLPTAASRCANCHLEGTAVPSPGCQRIDPIVRASFEPPRPWRAKSVAATARHRDIQPKRCVRR